MRTSATRGALVLFESTHGGFFHGSWGRHPPGALLQTPVTPSVGSVQCCTPSPSTTPATLTLWHVAPGAYLILRPVTSFTKLTPKPDTSGYHPTRHSAYSANMWTPGQPGTALSSLGTATLIGCHNNVLSALAAYGSLTLEETKLCVASPSTSSGDGSRTTTLGHWASQWPEHM